MSWINIDKRRSLKIKVYKNEDTNYFNTNPEVYYLNGQTSGFAWDGNIHVSLNDTEFAQLPLTGLTGFNRRASDFKSFVEYNYPVDLTSTIDWSLTGVTVTPTITPGYPDITPYTIEIGYDVNDVGVSILKCGVEIIGGEKYIATYDNGYFLVKLTGLTDNTSYNVKGFIEYYLQTGYSITNTYTTLNYITPTEVYVSRFGGTGTGQNGIFEGGYIKDTVTTIKEFGFIWGFTDITTDLLYENVDGFSIHKNSVISSSVASPVSINIRGQFEQLGTYPAGSYKCVSFSKDQNGTIIYSPITNDHMEPIY